MRAAAVLLLAVSVAASPIASPADNLDSLLDKRQCNADNCLRAIRNTARPGLADCSGYLEVTVTPATTTITETEMFTTTPTKTLDVTDTAWVTTTATETAQGTRTTTVATLITMGAVEKRQATELPTELPKYASACSSIARYRSACNCLGAGAPATVTAATPSTTVTVSETVTPTTVTELRTVTTDTATVTPLTRTQTQWQTSTVTTSIYAARPTFQVQLSGPVTSGFLDGRSNFLGVTASPQRELDAWTLDERGLLIHVRSQNFFYAGGVQSTGLSYVPGRNILYRDEPDTSSIRPIRCSVNGNRLNCVDGLTGRTLLFCATQPYGYQLMMMGMDQASSSGWGNCRVHQLNMVNI